MASRPLLQVYDADGKVVGQVRTPAVFLTPIRTDIVKYVHTNIRKNSRQPYSVAQWAGHQSSAESWGTGRAVARIPRVPGGGTHRAGQGAFGNMCRGGRMFSPLRTWRRWHRTVAKGQRRYAVASALAASAIPALVMSRGHRVGKVAELPLIVSTEAIEGLVKTKKAITLLTKLHADEDVNKVKNTVVHRAGKGKWRNRTYKEKLGPLLVHAGRPDNIAPAFKNVPGLELASVESLNLLRLAPGGHLGRFIIWSRAAIERLDVLWGTGKKPSQKKDFTLPRPILANTDIYRILRSDDVQRALKPKGIIQKPRRYSNPYRNKARMEKLNPYVRVIRSVHLSQEHIEKGFADRRVAKTKEVRKATAERLKKAATPKDKKKIIGDILEKGNKRKAKNNEKAYKNIKRLHKSLLFRLKHIGDK